MLIEGPSPISQDFEVTLDKNEALRTTDEFT